MNFRRWLFPLFGIVLIALFVIYVTYLANVAKIFPPWVGIGEYTKDGDTQPAKTLWDWLELLLVPVFLGLIGSWYSKISRENENISNERKERQAALENYLEKVNDIYLKSDMADEVAKVRLGQLIRAHTTTVMGELEDDKYKKGFILNFLVETGFLEKNQPIINLWGVNFENARMPRGAILESVCMAGINLNGSDLASARMHNSIFAASQLRAADLSGSTIYNTHLIGKPDVNDKLRRVLEDFADMAPSKLEHLRGPIPSNLENANLQNAKIKGSHFIRVNLVGADLRKAQIIEGDFSKSKANNADFRNARIVRTCFVEAHLAGANFEGAKINGDFSKADLRGVNFLHADLNGIELNGAKYNGKTIWPPDFNAQDCGAIMLGNEELLERVYKRWMTARSIFSSNKTTSRVGARRGPAG